MSYSPTSKPTLAPTVEPSPETTLTPTAEPSLTPTVAPTLSPTAAPTLSPTAEPSPETTLTPTANLIEEPTENPIEEPTENPISTNAPTSITTFPPVIIITESPTSFPTFEPSFAPTFAPTYDPAFAPTISPVINPALAPTLEPSFSPTSSPTAIPTLSPTIYYPGTYLPTSFPTVSPTHILKESDEEYAERTYVKYSPSDITRFGKSLTLGQDISLPMTEKYIKATITVPIILALAGYCSILLIIVYLLLMRFKGKKMLKFRQLFQKSKYSHEDSTPSRIEMAVISPISPPHLYATEPFKLDEEDLPKKNQKNIRSLFYLRPSEEYSEKRRLIFMSILAVIFCVATVIMFIVIIVKFNESLKKFNNTLNEIDSITSDLDSDIKNFSKSSNYAMVYYLKSLGMRESDIDEILEQTKESDLDYDDFMKIIKDLIKSGLIDSIFGYQILAYNPKQEIRRMSLDYVSSANPFKNEADQESPTVNHQNIYMEENLNKNLVQIPAESNSMTQQYNADEMALNICLSSKMTALGTNMTIITTTSTVLREEIKPLVNFVSNSNNVVNDLNLEVWIPFVYSILGGLSLFYVTFLLYSQSKKWKRGLKLSILFSILLFYFLVTVSSLILYIFTLSSDICMDPLTFVLQNLSKNELIQDSVIYFTKCYGQLPTVISLLNTGVDTVSGMREASLKLASGECENVESINQLADELTILSYYSVSIQNDMQCLRLRQIWNNLLYDNLCTDVQRMFFNTWICTMVSAFLIFCLLLDVIVTNYDELLTLKKSKDVPYDFEMSNIDSENSKENLSVGEESNREKNNNEIPKIVEFNDNEPLKIEVEDPEDEKSEVIVELYDNNKNILKSPQI